jgi:hypothetical protein
MCKGAEGEAVEGGRESEGESELCESLAAGEMARVLLASDGTKSNSAVHPGVLKASNLSKGTKHNFSTRTCDKIS